MPVLTNKWKVRKKVNVNWLTCIVVVDFLMYKSNHSSTLTIVLLYRVQRFMRTTMQCSLLKTGQELGCYVTVLKWKIQWKLVGLVLVSSPCFIWQVPVYCELPQVVGQDKLGSDMIFKRYEIIRSYVRGPNNLLTPVSVTQNNMNSLRFCGEISCIVPIKFISVVNTPLTCRCLFIQFDCLLYDESCFGYV